MKFILNVTAIMCLRNNVMMAVQVVLYKGIGFRYILVALLMTVSCGLEVKMIKLL